MALADGNDICMMESRHLYIIGNGFDLYHGAESRYQDFRTYLCRKRPHIASGFDLFSARGPGTNAFQSYGASLRKTSAS